MPQTKLTLSIDKERVERAKVISKARGTSLSQLVSRYFDSLSSEAGESTPTVKRLTGLLPEDVTVADYHRYLSEKHGA